MGDIINFDQAKNRLRPHADRRGFLIIELPEDVIDRFESGNPPTHLDIILR